jgi:hypothetical protein
MESEMTEWPSINVMQVVIYEYFCFLVLQSSLNFPEAQKMASLAFAKPQTSTKLEMLLDSVEVNVMKLISISKSAHQLLH